MRHADSLCMNNRARRRVSATPDAQRGVRSPATFPPRIILNSAWIVSEPSRPASPIVEEGRDIVVFNPNVHELRIRSDRAAMSAQDLRAGVPKIPTGVRADRTHTIP